MEQNDSNKEKKGGRESDERHCQNNKNLKLNNR